MKNHKVFKLCASVILVLSVFVITACSDPEQDVDTGLRGTVSLPAAVLLDSEVEAVTDNLSGSGEIFYEWLSGPSANGNFTTIEGETERTITLTEQAGVIEDGRYIKVVVTREGRDGSISSDPAQIVDSANVTITGVVISIAGNVTTVRPGPRYALSVTVTHDYTVNPEFFQEVIWKIDEIPEGIINRFINANNELTFNDEVYTGTITLSAQSLFDENEVSNTLNLDVEWDFVQYNPVSFTANSPFVNTAFPDKYGITTMPDGTEAYFFEHIKRTVETGTYEPSFRLTQEGQFMDLTPYTRMSVDMAVSNIALANDITSFFPRIWGSNEFSQWQRAAAYDNIKNNLGSSPGQFTTLEWFITGDLHGGQGAPMNQANIVVLRFIAVDQTDLPGRLFFRNIRFYTD